IRKEGMVWKTTCFESFRLIRPLFEYLPLWYSTLIASPDIDLDGLKKMIPLDERVIRFLGTIDFLPKVSDITTHTSGVESFRKRFFRFFNAFMMIRYMHYMRDQYFEDKDVFDEISTLGKASHWPVDQAWSEKEWLMYLRRKDRGLE
ncbi:MAG TPA: hypothetical protein VJ508_10850, partial [Saprospiraceae bacterium]|nr:hypothetical protein [Saprospiraceae bacterium]